MIKLIAKKGSELEQTLKEMTDQMNKNHDDGIRIVKEATGVEPESISYRWGWGEVATFLPTLVRFKKEDWPKVDEKVMRRDKRDENYFKPSMRYAAGKRLNERFLEEVTKKCIKYEPLRKNGIYAMFELCSVWIQPIFDKDRGLYVLLASESLPHGFTGKAKNEEEREFTIEY